MQIFRTVGSDFLVKRDEKQIFCSGSDIFFESGKHSFGIVGSDLPLAEPAQYSPKSGLVDCTV